MKLDKLNQKMHILIITLYGIVLTMALLGIGNVYGNKIDWLSQHVVFPEVFRQNFYQNKTLIPNFLFDIGGGQNIFNFTYYGFLNPGILLSYLLPFVNMTVYVVAFSIISYIASGILVYKFLQKHFGNNKAFVCAIIFLTLPPFTNHFHHHIMFVWYIPYFILSLIALDRYFEKGKYLLFILSAFLMIMTNYYFSVSALVFLFVYAIYRNLKSNDKLGKVFLKQGADVIILFIIPVALCGFLLLPTANQIFANTRTYSNTEYHTMFNLLYPKFQEFFYTHLGPGITGIILFAVLGNLCSKNKDKADIFLNAFAAFVLVCPLFIYVLNGMLYDRGKVAMSFAVIFLYCFCSFMQKLAENEINLKRTTILFSCYLVFSFFAVENILVGIALVSEICLMFWVKKKNIRYIYALVVASLMIATVAVSIYSVYVPIEYYKEMHYDETRELFEKADDGLYRTTVSYRTYDNSNKVYGNNFHSTSVYSSTSNRTYQDFYEKQMGNNQNSRNCFVTSGAENELFYTFMGTKYIVSQRDPGFYYEEVYRGENLNLYENKYAYPIGYKSKRTIGETQFDKMKFPYSSEALMNFTVVDKAAEVDVNSKIKQIDVKENYRFTKKEKESYTLTLDKEYENKILYLSFDVFSFEVPQGNNSFKDRENGDVSIKINEIGNKLTNKEWLYYNGNTSFEYVIPLENKTSLDIVITEGEYDIQNVKMFVSDMIYTKYDQPENLVMNERSETLSCKLTADEGEYFITTLPYDKGFTAYINGKQVPTEIVNKAFVGVKLQQGENKIEIKYNAPLFKEGVIISLFGLLLLVTLLLRKFIFDFIRKHREISMYVIFGAATTLVSLVTYFVCSKFIFNIKNPWELQAANIISWVISVLFAYVTNKKYVFRSHASLLKEIIKFYLSRVSTLLVDMALMYVLVTLCTFNDLTAKVVVQVVVIVLNYVLGKLLVFKEE